EPARRAADGGALRAAGHRDLRGRHVRDRGRAPPAPRSRERPLPRRAERPGARAACRDDDDAVGGGMPDAVAALQALMGRSTRTAGASVADSIAFPDRQMTAAELVAFWKDARMMAMATVGPAAQPHIAPVHSELDGTTLRLVIYDDTVRRMDLRSNP